jgi:hypothetical protein
VIFKKYALLICERNLNTTVDVRDPTYDHHITSSRLETEEDLKARSTVDIPN